MTDVKALSERSALRGRAEQKKRLVQTMDGEWLYAVILEDLDAIAASEPSASLSALIAEMMRVLNELGLIGSDATISMVQRRLHVDTPTAMRLLSIAHGIKSLRPLVEGEPAQGQKETNMDRDDERWEMIESALSTPDLKTPVDRLSAISAIVNSRKPLTEQQVQRTKELAAKYGWESAAPPGVRSQGEP